jgi:hypothetical protein
MSTEQQTSPEPDARAAAFSPKKRKQKIVTYGGHQYLVRLASMDVTDKIYDSDETPMRKGVRMIIACTYWPDDTPPHEKGLPRAGTRMFNDRDFDLIVNQDNDPDSLWQTLLEALTELRKKTPTIQEQVGNSAASPTSTPG